MKFFVFLFFLIFMRTTSFPIKQVWLVEDGEMFVKMEYNFETIVNPKETYIFTWEEHSYFSIIYLVGAQSKPYRKMRAAMGVVNMLKQIYENIPRGINMYLTRKTSDETIKKFSDVQKWHKEPEKIPRLYIVGGNDLIRQVQLKFKEVNDVDAFVLYNGSSVIVYYSFSTVKEKIKIAKSFAAYIVNFQRKKYFVDTPISELVNKKKSKTALKEFCSKIIEIEKFLSESKINSLPKGVVENSESINEKFNAKLNIATNKDDEKFETVKKALNKFMNENLSVRAENIDRYERIFSSDTTSSSSTSSSSIAPTFAVSTSTVPTNRDFERKHEVVKQKAKRKGKKKSLFLRSESANVATTSTTNDYDDVLPIFFGDEECLLDIILPVKSIQSTCLYTFIDLSNNEIFIYFGKDGKVSDYESAIIITEELLGRNPSANVTLIADDGNLTPPSFMIHFKTELNKYLGISL